MLHPVDLTTLAFPCILYIIQRTGLTDLKVSDILEYEYHSYNGITDNISPGDILVWKNENIKSEEINLQIDKRGRVLNCSVLRDKHYAILEEDSCISDMVTRDNNIPYIRVRELSSCRRPDGYIKTEDLAKSNYIFTDVMEKNHDR